MVATTNGRYPTTSVECVMSVRCRGQWKDGRWRSWETILSFEEWVVSPGLFGFSPFRPSPFL